MEYNFIFLNSNDDSGLIGLGDGDYLILQNDSPISAVDQFLSQHENCYTFFALSYDLKNKFEDLISENTDRSEFPLAILWCPAYVLELNNGALSFVQGNKDEAILSRVNAFLHTESDEFRLDTTMRPRTSKTDYLHHVNELQKELQFGNIYEVNYCQEFFAENVAINELDKLYHKVNKITSAPFSCYFNFMNHVIISGSPERFIRKQGDNLISQPIKGTIKRGLDSADDERLISQLKNDPKERAENVMIVDLVRNDLSKIAEKGSVHVDELFGIYSFKTVHQMISTISCSIPQNIPFSEVLAALFPMGSMTGAPKLSAMKLIEKHEDFRRGIYSGSVGYIDPKGDFDFNVIIRSLVYNKKLKYLSCGVGGAITIKSDPESEYEECFTKVNAILEGIRE